MLEIGRIMPFLGGGNQAGALKLTIQKFYRIAGGSTQLQGVASDIRLPSLFDQPEIGEGSLKGPLPYDEVRQVQFDKWERPLFKTELTKRSEARVATDPEFKYVNEDLERIKTRLAENKVSLNEKARLAEIEQDKARKQARTAARLALKQPELKVFSVTLENVTKPELELVSLEDKAEAEKQNKTGAAGGASLDPEAEEEDADKTPTVDAVRNESLNILADMVELSLAPKTASTTR
jgi:carboxyl-terminal processing protease